MQRLFTTFPNAWPGAGLLLMRWAVAWLLIIGVADPTVPPMAPTLGHCPTRLASWSVAVLLALGLYTPLAASACALLALICLPAGSSPVAVALIAFGIGLALIGPGAWSLDSRIFGRKRIDVTF